MSCSELPIRKLVIAGAVLALTAHAAWAGAGAPPKPKPKPELALTLSLLAQDLPTVKRRPRGYKQVLGGPEPWEQLDPDLPLAGPPIPAQREEGRIPGPLGGPADNFLDGETIPLFRVTIRNDP